MSGNNQYQLKVWAPALFALVLVLGMILGFNLQDTLYGKRDIQTLLERNDRLEQIIDLVHEKYVDSVSSRNLYEDAITGILTNLDPHTVYIRPDELSDINEQLEGGFYGIGVEPVIIRDTVFITSVIKGGPAEGAGVMTGDRLIKVNDSVIAGKQITTDKLLHMLKGKRKTTVQLTLKSPGDGSLRVVKLTRDLIPVYSVEASIKIDDITGYIKINRFSATTYEEFRTALADLKKAGIKQLVIDVRQNPGGYLDAAKEIADELLQGDKLIVYTQGLHSSRIDYKTEGRNGFEEGKIAILIDESSASASEILAGAVQDWDRGIVIGRRSYGKGLVQQQYDMDDGAALRLTIAKYYTPSGRCIQRSYAKGKEAYEDDFVHRFETGELTVKDTMVNEDTTRYYTKNKRIVYGGGGIKPDIYVPYDTAKLTPGILNILYSDEVYNLVWDYYMAHRASLIKFKSIEEFDTGFKADEMMAIYLKQQDPTFRKALMKVMRNHANYSFFNLRLKAQLAKILFHDNGYYSITTTDDDVVIKALQVLNSSQYSTVISR